MRGQDTRVTARARGRTQRLALVHAQKRSSTVQTSPVKDARLMSKAEEREERSGDEQGGEQADGQGGEDNAGGGDSAAAHKPLQGGGDTG